MSIKALEEQIEQNLRDISKENKEKSRLTSALKTKKDFCKEVTAIKDDNIALLNQLEETMKEN